jgi:hypothetical protein
LCPDREPNFWPIAINANFSRKEVYIPDFAPLNRLFVGRDVNSSVNHHPIQVFGINQPPDRNCEYVVNQTAVLTALDGTNPFHHLLMLFRTIFSFLTSFSVNLGTFSTTDCIFVIWRGHEPDFTKLTAFDSVLLSSLCRGGSLQLSRRSGVTCFSALLLGSSPGDWDMDLGPEKKGVQVDFSGVLLSRWIRERILKPGNLSFKGGIILVIRRGRREFVNENNVRHAIASSVHPASLDVINFENCSFQNSFHLISQSLVLTGVHGAALTNLIFLPPSAAVVEISISKSKTEYYFLALSFGKLYYEHSQLIPTDTHLSDLRDRSVTVGNVTSLGMLCKDALSTAAERFPSRSTKKSFINLIDYKSQVSIQLEARGTKERA